MAATTEAPRMLASTAIDALITLLRDDGYAVHGPVAHGDTVTFGAVTSRADLATGVRLDHQPGSTRTVPTGDDRYFGAVVGPDAARRFLIPPRARVVTTRLGPDGWDVTGEDLDDPPVALIGVRACDLAAIAVQDRVYLHGPAPDAGYAARRDRLFLVAVQCGEAAATCFCASMGTGPVVTGGADVVLTELLDGDHRFVATAGSERGAALLARLDTTPAGLDDVAATTAVPAAAAAQQTRTMRLDARDVLRETLESPHWEVVADRCLTCANCTLVCPTCFCTTVEDHTDLTGEIAERWRRWDSCFTTAFTHTAAGSVRTSAAARYRQWLTHKLSTWVDQFGMSGCVGCGRCITWCPVGIDLTEEVDALAAARGPMEEIPND